MLSPLFTACRETFDQLSHQAAGNYRQQVVGHVWQGAVIEGRLQGKRMMTLWEQPNPSLERITLHIPWKWRKIHVYANARYWRLDNEVTGATPHEVRRFLARVHAKLAG